jgi:putative transposase
MSHASWKRRARARSLLDRRSDLPPVPWTPALSRCGHWLELHRADVTDSRMASLQIVEQGSRTPTVPSSVSCCILGTRGRSSELQDSVAIGRRWYTEVKAKDTTKMMIKALRKVIQRIHYPVEVMLTCVRWYVAYPLSLRHIEEMMAERGVLVDHATIHRWSLKIVPALVKAFRGRKRPVGKSWRMDETYIKVRGQWKYLYRAVDRDGDTVDFLFTAHRDWAAARRFLERAIDRHGEPEKITIDKSAASTAAIDSYNTDHEAGIETRQCKYTSTTSSNRTIVPSSASCSRCWGSSPCVARASC